MTTGQSLAARLRAETRAARAGLVGSPSFAARGAGGAPLGTYGAGLDALATIWAALDAAVASGREPFLAACGAAAPPLPPTPRDERDGAGAAAPLAATELHGIMIAEELALRARRDPAATVGPLYALTWATLTVARVNVAAPDAVPVPAAWGASLAALGRESRGRWAMFRAALDTAASDPAFQARIVEAALDTFDGLAGLAAALLPGDTAACGAVLNPEAGRHAITDDPREVRAALRAGVRSWEACPYYERRYGRRGRRFTRSDSAWLVTLAGLPQITVDRQIGWLARLLAARGMPRWLLERHLLTLHEELVAGIPARRGDYARLLDAAARLRRERTAVLGEGAQRALAAAFDAAVGADWAARLPGAGTLLAAAVCDEAAGVDGAVESLLAWLADPDRFPALWLAAAQQTVADARQRAAQAA